jgi:uncharacterized protein
VDISQVFNLSLFGLLLIGTGVGLLSALLGIGGGLIMVPVLVWWGATPVQAVASSLVGVVLGSGSATYQYWQARQLNVLQVALIAPPAMLTTELGVWCANWLSADPKRAGFLPLSFAVLQITAIWLISLTRRMQKTQVSLDTSPLRIYQSQGIGLLAGWLSGLFGVGGGVVMVPLQMLFLKQEIKDAIRVSLGAVTLIAIWAIGRHAFSGNVLWLEGIYLGVGGVCGAQLGARVMPKIPDRVINQLFRGLLLLLAAYMIYKALATWSVLPSGFGSV